MKRNVVLCVALIGALVLAWQGGLSEVAARGGAVDASASNAVHPRAGRSAFPERNERRTRPIPAKRLSDEDPFATPADDDKPAKVVRWDQAHQHMGKTIIVEGKIVHLGSSRNGNVNFLNFDSDWRGKFYLVMFDDLAKTLNKSVDATFRGKTVRVKGRVEDHRGTPQMKIESMDQVEFVRK